MELRVLNYFLMVAREENITKAAQMLHVTQPTLSRQIANLEEELGVKLFQRSNHHIVLTDEGMLLKRRAQEIVDLADRTKRDFVQEEELTGEISIGSGELQSTQKLSEMIASFREKHPLVAFDMYSGNSDNIKEKIESGSLDLGLLVEPVDIGHYDFARMPGKETWGVLIDENSSLAKQDFVTPKDLYKIPLIYSKRELVQSQLQHWFGKYAEQVKVVATGNLLYNMGILARNKMGAVITIKLDCTYDGLTFVPLKPAIESRSVLVWKKAQPTAPATRLFLQHVKEMLL